MHPSVKKFLIFLAIVIPSSVIGVIAGVKLAITSIVNDCPGHTPTYFMGSSIANVPATGCLPAIGMTQYLIFGAVLVAVNVLGFALYFLVKKFRRGNETRN